MKDAAEASLRHAIDAPKGVKDKYKANDQAISSLKEESLSWYLTVQRRLSRRSISADLGKEARLEEYSWGEIVSLIGPRGLWTIAGVLLLLLVVSCTSTALLFRYWAPAQQSNHQGASKYLRDVASWHEVSNDDVEDSASKDLGTFMHTCAKLVRLPEVQLPKQLPQLPAWQADGAYPATPLDELALNCSHTADDAACKGVAASSNLYEGDSAPLSPAELAELKVFLQAPLRQHAAVQATSSLHEKSDLDVLALDCEADPTACAAVAQASNSYDAVSADEDVAAATEALAYLDAIRRLKHQPWSTMADQAEAHQQQDMVPQPNMYEGAEEEWTQRRISEEAGAQYFGPSLLDLDCTTEANNDVAAECERTRAVNKYETAVSGNLDPITLASDLAYSMQEYQRTAGYDAVAVNWDDSNSQHPPADLQGDLPLQGHMDYVGMSEKQFDRLQLLQEQLQEIIRQTRVTGYDVPAVDADSMDEFGTLAPLGATSAGAADSGVVRDLDKLEQARQYFKNPCNSPAAQQDHKNSFNHDAHRMYYKNPANVPVVLHQQPSQVQGPESSTVDSTGTDYITWLAAVATFAASVAGTWYTLTQGFSAKKEPATQDDDQLREPLVGAGSVSPTSTEDTSCELPAPNLTALSTTPESSPLRSSFARSMALPAIDELTEDEVERPSVGQQPGSSSDAGCSSTVLIEGVSSGVLNWREDFGSDNTLTTARSTILQTRPSMLIDVPAELADNARGRVQTSSADRNAMMKAKQ